MRFSFHTPDDVPRRLPSGLLDCSGTNYESFKQHVECNFLLECEHNEDEIGCDHTSAQCNGAIAYGNSCLKLYVEKLQLSWVGTQHKCKLNNAHLPVVQTTDLFNKLVALLLRMVVGVIPIKLEFTLSPNPALYRNVPRWSERKPALGLEPFYDHRAVEDGYKLENSHTRLCGHIIGSEFSWDGNWYVVYSACDCSLWPYPLRHYLCEYSVDSHHANSQTRGVTLIEVSDHVTFKLPAPAKCPGGHVTHDFLSCDPDLACHADAFVYTCKTETGGAVPSFTCADGLVTSSFTVTCDHHDDCGDGSDEDWCVFEPCGGFQCEDFECIRSYQVCDGVFDCKQREDEWKCPGYTEDWYSHSDAFLLVESPSVVDLDGFGNKIVRNVSVTAQREVTCPPTHFKCPDWHCLPVFLRCNGVKDCVNDEDEVNCQPAPPCPGYYRCRHSAVCLHHTHVCDGVYHCPLRDDELYCQLTCPEQCRCQGLAFVCPAPFPAHLHRHLRYLDASGSGMGVANITDHSFLVSLVLRHCGLDLVHIVTLPNLRSLDVSHNKLTSITLSQFSQLTNLVNLTLSWNPVRHVLVGGTVSVHTRLRVLNLAGMQMDQLTVDEVSRVFPNVTVLNVSGGEFHTVAAFSSLHSLQMLDLTECDVLDFPSDVFQGLSKLREVRADNHRLCCYQIVPETLKPASCLAPVDEVSSCDDLLRAPIYRIFVWIFSVVAIAGNIVSFAVRCFVHRNASKTGFGVFVTHLSLSDLLMGVYLKVIGVADLLFQGSYLWEERQWKQSVTCKLAGFLSLLSNEVSALIVCLITLDRFLVLRFPFSQRRFGGRSATVTCVVAWLTGLIVAAVPLFPVFSHWDFYGQTGICIPLPITRKQFAGQGYSFAVMIVTNFVLFCLIAVGQIGVFTSVRANAMSSDNNNNNVVDINNNRNRDLAIARRLAVIIISDFLCWFPVGLLGLLVTLLKVPIPGEAGVAVAIFVLPLNSALNPFLYTVNVVLAKRAKLREQKLLRVLEARVLSQMKAASTPHTNIR